MMHGCSAITEAQTQAFLEAMQGDAASLALYAKGGPARLLSAEANELQSAWRTGRER